jgi:hypothetical protein
LRGRSLTKEFKLPKFFSELQSAALENLGSDTTPGVAGRFYRNTVDGKMKVDSGAAILAVVTETQTQTLTNKTLTSPTVNTATINTPTIDVMTIDGQASSPANPSAGFYKVYVKADGRAYMLNSSGIESGLGSGGAATLNWFEDEEAPPLNTANRMQAYFYASAQGSALYAEFVVPTGYAPGTQIIYKGKIYFADVADTILMQTVSTLVRENNDLVSSTTNQRTSTNSAITATAGNALKTQQISFDLTSSTGTINSVAVAVGDTILVKLIRGTDTAAGVVGFLHKQGELKTS